MKNVASDNVDRLLAKALWKIYRRPARPRPWRAGGNLPWNEPAFSERMLGVHLDDSHGAASRVTPERSRQIEWLWQELALRPGRRLFDVTCGPGLYAVEFARRGCSVTGIDFSPAAIAYARDLALSRNVAAACHFVEQDIRSMAVAPAEFDAAILLYGQLAVFPAEEAQQILAQIARSLKPGGRLCLELLDQEQVDKTEQSWWFTDDTGLWGEAPFLHLGRRFWDAAAATSMERYYIIHLDSGQLTEILLCEQTYSVETMGRMLTRAGFRSVAVYPAWAGLPLYDAPEWVVYIAET